MRILKRLAMLAVFVLLCGFGNVGGGGGGSGTGTVTSVSGTANQVGVATGTTTPVISLVGPYTPATYTAHGNLIGEGTSSIVAMAVCGTGSFIYGQAAADPICSTLIMPNAATAGDLLAATSTNTVGSIADVAVNQVLASGGVGVVPAWTTAPTISGANITPLKAPYGATTYTIHGVLLGQTTSNITATAAGASGTFLLGQGAADPIWSTLTLPNSATQGDLLTATGANAVGSLADVATGQVLASGGTSTVPAYTANPVVTSIGTGTAPTVTAGTGGVFSGTEGTAPTAAASTDELWADSTAHAWKFNNNNGTTEQVVGTSAGVVEGSLSMTGLLGGLTSTAAATLLGACDVAVAAGHFTSLNLTNDLNAGSCTTAPGYNIRDNTGSTTGTAKSAGTTAGTVTQAETLTFAAGDTICLVRTTNGATCTAPFFNVTAHYSMP